MGDRGEGCLLRRWWLGLPLLSAALLALFAVPAVALPPGCSQSGQTVTCTYTSGSNPFTVPAGVSSIHVVAVGGMGGAIDGASGGHGAIVSGDVSVVAGSTLSAVVGASGGGQTLGGAYGGIGGSGSSSITTASSGDGGANGGGASDVRSSENDLSSRLLVAGGGGGAGGGGFEFCTVPNCSGGRGGGVPGGAGGGGAGGDGQTFAGGGGGGGGGGSTGGSAGVGPGGCAGQDACFPGTAAEAGGLGFGGHGGAGGSTGEASGGFLVVLNGGGGGGGGGGVFGGGGGGGNFYSGGGGGGGSNSVPLGGSQAIDATGTPLVQISYTISNHSTATSVSCSPNTFAPGDATACTATVTDTGDGGQTTPTGTVSFTNSGAGGFGGSPCTLSGSGASASCAVFFTSFPRSGHLITASYGGDATHTGSAGGTLVLVAVPESTDGCVVFGHGRIIAANGDRASFRGLAIASPPRGAELYRDNGPANPMRVRSSSVDAVTCNADASRAGVFGRATLNGAASVEYRIDIRLAATKGGMDSYRIRLSNGYDSGAQPIRHGDTDIRIRNSEHHHHDANAEQDQTGDNQDGG